MDQPAYQPSRPVAIGICAALVIAFITIGWMAVRQKSPTYDEPLYAVSSWLALKHHDLRITPEHAPLWNYWAALPNLTEPLNVTMSDRFLQEQRINLNLQFPWMIEVLYRTPTNNVDALIARSKFMMLLLGAMLVAGTGAMAWRIGGPVAGVVATALIALDPNFLGHSALIVNDVATALAYLGVIAATWSVGRRATWINVVLLGLVIGAGIGIKLSGIAAVFLVPTALGVRAMLPEAWTVLGRAIQQRSRRFVAAMVITIVAGLLSWLTVWGVYGFRYLPSSDPTFSFDMSAAHRDAAEIEMWAKHPAGPTAEQRRDFSPSGVLKGAALIDKYHLMPQPWTRGFMHSYGMSLRRLSYLHGEVRSGGTWIYYPLAVLYKTPVATLILLTLTIATATYLLMHRRKLADRWTIISLLIPIGIFAMFCMTSNLNLGIRYLLPAYAPAYVLMALVAGYAWEHFARSARMILAAMLLCLAGETLSAYPNYLAYFNVACGGARGGYALLGDSNLDWGQDLPALADWQRANPDVPLYLCYFGSADPAHYWIRYSNLPGGYKFGPKPVVPSSAGVVAISATARQCIYQRELKPFYSILDTQEPIDVLGGTIYLYRYPFAEPPK